jgi:transglutaminase-like putative cysteine protease
MVPMRGIFEHLGAQVYWYPETREVVGYKDNNYIKLQINSETYYKNGNSDTLDSPPIIVDGRTMVPIRFIAESLDMNVDWSKETRTVTITYPDETDSYENFDGVFYRKIDLTDYGLAFMIPSFWSKSEQYDYVWEFQGYDTNIDIAVEAKAVDKDASLDDFSTESKQALLDLYTSTGLAFTGSDSINVNNLDMEVAYLTLYGDGYELYQVIFYFMGDDQGYTATFTYDSKTNESDTLKTIKNIIGTVSLKNLSVSFSEEHYIEYDKFFEMGVHLASPIYSNMETENSFVFNGYVNEYEAIPYFTVKVSKGENSLMSKVPVYAYEFETPIYTPFGLGKHDIVIATPPNGDNIIDYIMQFSVINTSIDSIRYLVPSTYVNPSAPEIEGLADEIALEAFTDEEKVLGMMKWISSEIIYSPGNNGAEPQDALELLESKKGDCDEISFLFASVLRNLEIPVKIMAGKLPDGDGHAWTEVQINGSWIIVDPTWGSGYINERNGLYVKEFNSDYYNLNREEYEEQFVEIEEIAY